MEKNLKIVNCEICEKTFSSNGSKSKHMIIVHEEQKKFICNVCNKSFGYKNELTLHIENYHQGARHVCKNCGKIFARSKSVMNISKIYMKGKIITNVILVKNPSVNQEI